MATSSKKPVRRKVTRAKAARASRATPPEPKIRLTAEVTAGG